MSEYMLLRRKLYICTAVQAVKMFISSNPIERFYGPLEEHVHKFSSKSKSKNVLGTNGLNTILDLKVFNQLLLSHQRERQQTMNNLNFK